MTEPVGPPRAGQDAGKSPGIPWRLLVRREWGLLVLAGALTVMVFSLVSDDITREWSLTAVPVTADTGADDLVVLFPPGRASLKFDLLGSNSDFLEAERATRGPGARPARLLLGEVRAASRRLGVRDRLVVPFPESYVKQGSLDEALRSLEGFVYRVRPREVAIATPATIPDAEKLVSEHGVTCEIVLEGSSTTSLLLPDGMALGPLTPDPIDLTALLRDRPADGTLQPLATKLQFSAWCAEGRAEGEQLYRSHVALPSVGVEVRWTISDAAWDSTALANTVVLLVKDRSAFDFRVPANDRIGMDDLMYRVEGLIRAPRDLHARLQAAGAANLAGETLGGWVWGIEIVAGELPHAGEPPDPNVRLEGHLRFVPLHPDFQDPRIRFEPRDLQKVPFEISITRRE